MNKKIFLIVLFFLNYSFLFTQKITISGYVKDAESGEPLIGAKIFDIKSKKGVIANEYGFYSLTLLKDSVRLKATFFGYGAMKYEFMPQKNKLLTINLNPIVDIEEVEISSQKRIEEESQMSSFNISMEKVKALPVFLGETDILKTIQLFPGVQSGSEGASGLYVRGGGADQNLILLDGVPVYNASHLFGFFSVFNSDAINNAQMIKGGFPARYGGRLSSVLDIHMKEGNTKKFKGEGSIGIISSKLTLEGPIIKDKTSFLVSGRRTYVDLWAIPLINSFNNNSGGGKGESGSSSSSNTGGYYFWDLNAKINHKFSDKSRLYVSGYFGKDRFYGDRSNSYPDGGNQIDEQASNALEWGNAIGAIRWNKIISPKLFMNVTATYSQYQFGVGFTNQTTVTYPDSAQQSSLSSQYDSGIRDWTGKVDFTYYPNANHSIKFGLGNTYHTFIPGVNQFQVNQSGISSVDSTFGSTQQYGHEHWIYIEDDWEISEKIKFNIGLNFSGFQARESWYPSIQPRFSGRFLVSKNSAIKASYSRMSQFLHLLTNPSIGLPTDLWVPVTDRVAPEHSNQYALGYSQTLKKGIQFSVEAYYKDMFNLVAYQDGASFFGSGLDWQDKIEIGRGNSYGVEFLLEKKIGKTTGWIGYTLNWSNRQFDNINFGNPFPHKYDRRHDIGIAITHEFNEKVDIGVVWVFGSGYATTLAQQTYNGIDGLSSSISNNFEFTTVEHIENRNNYRMPSYHRLDVGVNLHKKRKKYTRTWSFGLYNAYSRQNPFYLYFDQDANGDLGLYQLSLFPIIPSISYKIKF
ncbi:MAG: TonB-dependent receptor plug domain-containing protein [Crocinitomicaceae bacterium]|nr:TonB-dependent receptor plug domain-containing protein [Crocinitomicaceae bacterium]